MLSSNGSQVKIISRNKKIEEIIEKIDKIVKSDSSVLLVGETGVGKEIFAEYIHYNSLRAANPFVKISLSTLPSELLESELFGHTKGSFTSAHSEKKGLFEIASSGSIFLDDIDDVPMQIQPKLLRVLESREIMRVGDTSTIPVDVRLITASKVDLKLLMKNEKFRADLFYRINVVPIYIPPLRERINDIEPLARYFLDHYAKEKNLRISPEAMEALENYSWPGNVRELRNVMQRISLFVEDEIKLQNLPPDIRNNDPIGLLIQACDKCFLKKSMTFDQVVTCLERNLLAEALQKSDCNQSEAARNLGLSLSTFRDKLKKHSVNCNGLSNNFPNLR